MKRGAAPGAAASYREEMVSDFALQRVPLSRLKGAIEASWDSRTAYLGATRPGNPALGQCYPTARVVQWFFPDLEIVSGKVRTDQGIECHFWNIERSTGTHIDLSWSQFPPGSTVQELEVLDRSALGDSPPTIARCQLLLERVLERLAAERESA